MNTAYTNIIPITKARNKLGILAEKVKGEEYVVLTKGGSPTAALVDIDYLARLERDIKSVYQKTFIDPKLLPYTREFTNSEIKVWEKEDAL